MNLHHEMNAAAARVRLPHLERLRALGVPYAQLGALNAEQHTVGIARIESCRNGLFDYSEEGVPACIVAVVDHWREPGDAGIFDLVAFAADNPARWWGRTGAAFALGDHLLETGDPVAVVATPVDWLACGGDALCILDWGPASPAWSALRAAPPLTFTDDGLRTKLRNALVQAAPLPPMELVA